MSVLFLKSTFSILAVALVFLALVPYIRDTIRGKTRPHIYSWLFWSISAGIVSGLQFTSGAGVGVWATLVVAFLYFIVFALGYRNHEDFITKTDTVFFVIALIALYLWLLADQPILSIILITCADIIAIAPTVRKSWNLPQTETISAYGISAFRQFFVILALESYSIVTWFYPAVWVIVCVGFVAMLSIRRKVV